MQKQILRENIKYIYIYIKKRNNYFFKKIDKKIS
jgi:hypothetical protein